MTPGLSEQQEPNLEIEAATSQGFLLPSGSKRGKKAARKGLCDIQPASLAASLKYQDISGVSDWFLKKRLEMEKGAGPSSRDTGPNLPAKKSIYNYLPLSTHSWRPPRIDKVKY